MKNNIQDVYRLAPMQLGMFYLFLKDSKSSAYFEQCTFSINGEVDKVLLKKSFNALIDRYDILRTVFYNENVKEPLQVVLAHRSGDIYFQDISHQPEDQKEPFIERIKIEDKEKGFDLSRDLLMRILLFKIGDKKYKLIWSFHHIVMDGWCLGVIFKELILFYMSYQHGEPIQLKPVTPYKNYIKWLERQDMTEGVRYWKNYLKGYENKHLMLKFAGFPGDRRSSGYIRVENNIPIADNLSEALAGIAREKQVTPNMVFQLMWGILLARYNNTDDVVFGSVVSGRPSEVDGIEDMVGIFINTIPVRIRIDDNKKFSQLLKELQQQESLSKSYEYSPLAEVQSYSSLKGELIDHVMGFENFPMQQSVGEKRAQHEFGFEIKDVYMYEQINYDFSLGILPGKPMTLVLHYNSLVYEAGFIKKVETDFMSIAQQVAHEAEIPIKGIQIVSAEEQEKMLSDFNDDLELD